MDNIIEVIESKVSGGQHPLPWFPGPVLKDALAITGHSSTNEGLRDNNGVLVVICVDESRALALSRWVNKTYLYDKETS